MRPKELLGNGPSVYFEVFLLGAVLIGIGVVHGYCLREGHPWGDDFAQYLMHARNLAEGRPYAQTGYIYHPEYPQLGPPAYPPGTPLLLAPIWKLWGLNWTALKWSMIGCLLVWLALLNWYFRADLPVAGRLFLIALIGLNPLFLDQTNTIGSDLPFLVWVYLSLLLLQIIERAQQPVPSVPYQPASTSSGDYSAADRSQQPGCSASSSEATFATDRMPQGGSTTARPGRSSRVPRGSGPIGWYLAAALAVWAASATRTIGLVVWAVVLLADWIRHRRLRPCLIWSTGLFLLLNGILLLLIPGTTGYLAQLSFHPLLWAEHSWQYGRQLAAFWRNDFSKSLAASIAGIVSLLALLGYCGQCRRQLSVREIFPLLYGSVVVVWPSYQGFRMLDPVVPLWLFYAWLGLAELWKLRSRFRQRFGLLGVRILAIGLAGAIVAGYTSNLFRRPLGPLPEGIGRPSSQELFQAVQKYTQPEDVLIFIKPRALALCAERSCSVYHPVQTDEQLWAYFAQIHAKFLVVVRRPEAFQGAEDLKVVQFLADFAARNQHQLQPVWANEDFVLYRLQQ
ncbi:MAG: hypothetical protein RMI90_09455 [Thermoguttaceae bacterium]|nr:hypothetical protein [Thermoguttaceae bacterium]